MPVNPYKYKFPWPMQLEEAWHGVTRYIAKQEPSVSSAQEVEEHASSCDEFRLASGEEDVLSKHACMVDNMRMMRLTLISEAVAMLSVAIADDEGMGRIMPDEYHVAKEGALELMDQVMALEAENDDASTFAVIQHLQMATLQTIRNNHIKENGASE